jgi:hypothetical protein
VEKTQPQLEPESAPQVHSALIISNELGRSTGAVPCHLVRKRARSSSAALNLHPRFKQKAIHCGEGSEKKVLKNPAKRVAPKMPSETSTISNASAALAPNLSSPGFVKMVNVKLSELKAPPLGEQAPRVAMSDKRRKILDPEAEARDEHRRSIPVERDRAQPLGEARRRAEASAGRDSYALEQRSALRAASFET